VCDFDILSICEVKGLETRRCINMNHNRHKTKCRQFDDAFSIFDQWGRCALYQRVAYLKRWDGVVCVARELAEDPRTIRVKIRNFFDCDVYVRVPIGWPIGGTYSSYLIHIDKSESQSTFRKQSPIVRGLD
jgi:hypothetical protein